MECRQPPPLSDEEINAALDGVASADVTDHLAGCSHCRARLAQAQEFEYHLGAALHRWDCPSSQQLGEYHLGLLGGAADRAIAAHLRVCARCTQEVEELRLFLGDDAARAVTPAPAAERPWQSRTPLQTVIARLLPSRPSTAVRGAGRAPMVAQSPLATVVLDPVTQGTQETMLVGQIADDQNDQDRWTGALVAAYRQGAFVGVAVVDDLGSFTCGPLPSGVLDIHITSETGPSIRVNDVPV
jgi:hypothetical protein